MVSIEDFLQELVLTYGPLGVFIGMLLESSIIPLPSEIVLITAGIIGIDLLTIVVYGTIGSTLGSIIGYYIGKLGGRPVIEKYGKYMLISEAKIKQAEEWTHTHGSISIFIARLVPFIPFKVFSIAAGILKFDLKLFILYTFLGLIPRTFILAYIGLEIKRYQDQFYIIAAISVVLAILFYIIHKKFNNSRLR
ncbi:DedA family protein [Candidatus Micrarchaeota archaeon]|nr:DedA family protein [Candidatus Micrarchaeota archaeon]